MTDTRPPVFTVCPGNFNLGCNPPTIPDCDLSTVTATDNCGTPVVTCTRSDTVQGCTITRTLTYTATDGCGQTAVCVQKITWTGGASVMAAVPDPGYSQDTVTHAVWLPGIATDLVFTPTPGSFVTLSGGTAKLSGTVYSASNPSKGFTINVNLSGLQSTPPPGSPKQELAASAYAPSGPINAATWKYYTVVTGTLTGAGSYAGAVINITRTGPAFQIGTGANGKNLNMGASTWFAWTVVSQPSSGSPLPAVGQGDFNLDLTGCCPPPTLACASGSGQVGVPYSSALVASGGTPPYTYSIIVGSLPPGLTLNPVTGAITGTPTQAGSFAFVARVVDSSGVVASTATANCVITIMGVGGCRVTGGSNHQTNSYQSACITTALPTHVSHGGQVGAPFSVGSPFTPNSPCISGEWQHNRHLKGNSLVGNFHASGNGNQHQFDSLLCACLPCAENPNAVGVIGGNCNPGDRICGPEPRKAPANKICFSGVGDYTFTNGKKTVKAVFRVDIEDRSEGNSQSSSSPPDRYRIRLWVLDPSCGRNPDPNSAEAMALRYAASADPATIGTLATTENLKVNIQPDIDDGGNMTQGNHQIHPATGASCGALVAGPAARLDVITEIAGMTPSGGCTFGKMAKGHQGKQDPAFVYRVTVVNSGTVALTNVSVFEMTDTTYTDTTTSYFAVGSTVAPGASVTRYRTNAWALDTINTAEASGNSKDDGSSTYAASTAMASVGAAELNCSMTLTSDCDQDGTANDNHLKLPPGVNCQVRLNIQICNTGQSDLVGVTVTNTGWACSWPTFDLAQGACTNLSCVTTLSCPAQPILPVVTVTGKVQPDCSSAACSIAGATILVSTNCSGRVENCVPLAAAPAGLTVTPGNGKVVLSWNALSGATSYNVKRATSSGGPYTTLKTGLTTTTYTDATVVNGTVYYYVVSAIKSGVETANTAQLNAIPATALPIPWSTKDIGSVAAVGGVNYSAGTFSVIGSGADIWNSADAFRFVYQSAKSDCSIVAKVLSVQRTDPSAKVGVMIRDSLNADSSHAFVALTPDNGIIFQTRSSTGGSSVISKTITGVTAPYWVKIVRTDNSFAGYYSFNGAAWTQMGTAQTLSMGINPYIGLGVTSRTNGVLCSGALDNVTATP